MTTGDVMDDVDYKRSSSTLFDSSNNPGIRYQAAMKIQSEIGKSSATTKLVAKDLKSYITFVKEAKERNLLQAVFDVILKLAQQPGHKEEFTAGGLPSFCVEYASDERFRMKISIMILSLLSTSSMVDNLVEIGIVDVLLRYTDLVDRRLLPEQPSLVLTTRKNVFQSLAIISEDKTHRKLLIEKNIIGIVKKNCFDIGVAEEISRIAVFAVDSVRGDEITLIATGLQIIHNMGWILSRFGRFYVDTIKDDLKYVYEVDSDEEDEPEEKESEKKTPSDLKPSRFTVRPIDEVETHDIYGLELNIILLNQFKEHNIIDTVMATVSHITEVFSRRGLVILSLIGNALHWIVSEHARALIIRRLLDIAKTFSGQRRFLCFRCLMTLSSHVQNCSAFVQTDIFESLFFLGMEESGPVLNSLIAILYRLSVHKSTAEEQALRSRCPKLIVKVLNEDFKGEVNYDAKDTDWASSTSAYCLNTLANLAMNSTETREALVDAGAVPVVTKILAAHPTDFVGMSSLTCLSYIHSSEKENLMPECGRVLINQVVTCLSKTLKNEPYEGFIFTVEELVLALKGLSMSPLNWTKLVVGLPVFVKVLSQFVNHFGKHEDGLDNVSRTSVSYITGVLYKISGSKRIVAELVLLGEEFQALLDDVQDILLEGEDIMESDNETVTMLQSLQLTISDGIALAKFREENDEKNLRKSSRFRWSGIFGAGELEAFLEKEKIECDI